MTTAATALASVSGTTHRPEWDSRPRKLSYKLQGICRTAKARPVPSPSTGTSFLTSAGAALTTDDERVAESYLAHFPDAIFLQLAAGGGLRRIGSHFRTDNGQALGYTGAVLDTVCVHAERPAWTGPRKSATARTLHRSGRRDWPSERDPDRRQYRSATDGHSNPIQQWTQQSGQWYPGQITRLENGTQVLRFQVQQSSGVRHTDCTLTRALRARFTFSRMSEAEAVQMKGLGRSL